MPTLPAPVNRPCASPLCLASHSCQPPWPPQSIKVGKRGPPAARCESATTRSARPASLKIACASARNVRAPRMRAGMQDKALRSLLFRPGWRVSSSLTSWASSRESPGSYKRQPGRIGSPERLECEPDRAKRRDLHRKGLRCISS
jgi:hypothetical protein